MAALSWEFDVTAKFMSYVQHCYIACIALLKFVKEQVNLSRVLYILQNTTKYITLLKFVNKQINTKLLYNILSNSHNIKFLNNEVLLISGRKGGNHVT